MEVGPDIVIPGEFQKFVFNIDTYGTISFLGKQISTETSAAASVKNYSVMALVQLELGSSEAYHMKEEEVLNLYNKYIYAAKGLMDNKNHDYEEAWRDMRLSSLTDIILMKLMRIKQIEDNKGKTFASEGVDANYYDIINYAIFALIKLEEQLDKNFKNL